MSGIFEFTGFDAIFIAKLVDFAILVVGVSVLYRVAGNPVLVRHQEDQNRAVEEALVYGDRAGTSVEEAKAAVEKAKTDSVRMVELAHAQAQRLIADERANAHEHAERVVAHAQGELDRERIRVRRELLAETVQRAHAQAQEIVKNELTEAQQRELIDRFTNELEASRA